MKTAAEARRRAFRDMPEEELLGQVIQMAASMGWSTAHFRPAKSDRGWRTAVQGDGVGFPDLVLLRSVEGRARCVVAELKSTRGRPTPQQQGWLILWRTIPGVEVYIWHPADLESGEIERCLS